MDALGDSLDHELKEKVKEHFKKITESKL